MRKITRRTALQGTAAVAAVAVPGVAAAAQADPLLDIIGALREVDKEWRPVEDALQEAKAKVGSQDRGGLCREGGASL